MWYEINVSKDGSHLFATHERSIQNEGSLNKVMNELLPKFPESEGYKITVTRWRKTGAELEWKSPDQA